MKNPNGRLSHKEKDEIIDALIEENLIKILLIKELSINSKEYVPTKENAEDLYHLQQYVKSHINESTHKSKIDFIINKL